MNRLIALSLGLLAHGVWAQWGPWTEDWSAGVSAWHGDTFAFGSGAELRLAAPAAGTYALWRSGLGGRPAQASGRVRLDFNPSSSNFAFWEVRDTAASGGYRLEFGRSSDQLRLTRRSDGLLLAASSSGLLDRAASVIEWAWTWDSAAGHRLEWLVRDTLGIPLDSGSAWGNADSSAEALGEVRFGATVTATRTRSVRWGPLSFAANALPARKPIAAARLGDVAVTEILVDPEPKVSWRSSPGDFVELLVTADSARRAVGWTLAHGSGRWLLPDRILQPGEVLLLADARMDWPDSLRIWDVPLALTASAAFWSLATADSQIVAWGRTQPDMHQPSDKALGGWSLETQPELAALPRAWQSSRNALGSSPGRIEFAPVGPRQGGILGLLADSVLHVDWRHPLPLGTSAFYPFDSLALADWSGGHWVASRPHSERTDLYWDSGLGRWPGVPGQGFELPLIPGWVHADGTPGDCTLVAAGWPAVPDSGEVQITEVLFNPLPGEGRFVELRNVSGRVLDVSGLFWASGDSLAQGSWRRAAVAGRFLLPEQVMFGAADPLAVVRRYPAGDSAAGPRGAPRPGAWARPAVPGGPGATSHALPLTDDGGTLELRRSDGLRIDWARVSPHQFPSKIRETPGKGEGMSLERRGPDPDDWAHTRSDSATPGRWPQHAPQPAEGQFDLVQRQWPPQLSWNLDSDRAWLLETRWVDPEGRWATPWTAPQPVAPQHHIEALDEPPHRQTWLWEFRFTPSEGRPIRRSYLVTSN